MVIILNEVMQMLRISRAIRWFSSIMQNLRKKISFKKLLLLGFLAALFTVNAAFWYIRYNTNPQQPEDYASPREWEINLNEERIPEPEKEENIVERQPVTEQKVENEEEKAGSSTSELTRTDTAEEDLNKKEEASVIEAFAENPKTMIMPVAGKIITDHSKDTLVYSKTLEQWCAHKGVDIAAEVGTPVKAAMAGTVVEVRSSDPKLGVVVVIDHGNGLKTLYGNLMSDNLVHKGKHVKKGDVIGGVGKTAPFEIEDPPHLHFEVLKGNESVDPKNFLPNL
ncbi:MAG: M23 family metallopeptidase [Thermosediminibacteraceae bacterium]|nr:M23 family metallopeptidase [Thermosediminibacteraceae bacterium]